MCQFWVTFILCFIGWGKKSSLVSSQFLWYNSYIKIDNKVVCYKDFTDKKINYISNLFDENTQWLSVNPKIHFKWFQLIHAIPRPWKLAVLNNKGNCKNIYLKHHLIKNSQILVIEKLIPKELYSLLLFWKINFLRPKNNFATFSPIHKLNGKRFISCHVKLLIDTNLRIFQYKILNNILYIKQLFIFNKKDTKLLLITRWNN